MINFLNEDYFVTASLSIFGKSYGVTELDMGFNKGIDYKGQPQNETRGGVISITLDHAPDAPLYDWAKRNNKKEKGQIKFSSKDSGTRFSIDFEDAYCVELIANVNSQIGASVSLVISPRVVSVNGVKIDNAWT